MLLLLLLRVRAPKMHRLRQLRRAAALASASSASQQASSSSSSLSSSSLVLRALASTTAASAPRAGRRRPLQDRHADDRGVAGVSRLAQRLLQDALAEARAGRIREAVVLLDEAIAGSGRASPKAVGREVAEVLRAASEAAAGTLAQERGRMTQASSGEVPVVATPPKELGLAAFFEGPGQGFTFPVHLRFALLACNRAGRPREATRLIAHMASKGLPIPAAAYAGVLVGAATAGEHPLALEMLAELRANYPKEPLKERELLSGLQAAAVLRDAGTARSLLKEVTGRTNLDLTHVHYRAAIEACLACGLPAEAPLLLRVMEERWDGGVRMLPFPLLKEVVLACAGDAGDEEGARAVLAYVRNPGLLHRIQPELQAVSPALAREAAERAAMAGSQPVAAGGRARRGAAAAFGIPALGPDASPQDYAKAVAALVAQGRWDLAKRLLLLAAESKGPGAVDAGMVLPLLKAYLKGGAFDSAWAFFHDEALGRLRVRPTSSLFAAMLEGCDRAARGREAMALVREAEARGVVLSERTLGLAVRACARSRETRNARRLVALMESRGFSVPASCFWELAESEAVAGKGDAVLYEAASRGVRITPGFYVAAGFPARALELYEALPKAERTAQDFKAALAAAGHMADGHRVARLLDGLTEEELGKRGGGGMADRSAVSLACRALRRQDGEAQEDQQQQQQQQQEGVDEAGQRAAVDAVLRLMARRGWVQTESKVIRALQAQGRGAEARALMDQWLARRLLPEDASSSAASSAAAAAAAPSLGGPYCAAMGALGLLGQWPVAHYLYDEALVLFHGKGASCPAFLRALVYALDKDDSGEDGQKEEQEDGGAVGGGGSDGGLLRSMALRAYRDAHAQGWMRHWARQGGSSGSSSSSGSSENERSTATMDVHRFPFKLARLAVDAVLEEMLLSQRESGGRGPLPDLWILTGTGKHVNEAGQVAYQATLRDHLARHLHEQRGLLTQGDLEYLASLDPSKAGRLRVRGEALKAWTRAEAGRRGWQYPQQQGGRGAAH